MYMTYKPTVTLATATLLILSAFSAPVKPSTDDPSKDVDKLIIVDCMLPGKIMRLGGGARYMSARRPVKTTGAHCEIRGGEYVAYDRATYATSLKVWLPDAKAGDAKAQTYVGEMFEQGLGTTPDFAMAVSWYRKAAEQGYDRAQMNLGSMYERGLGVEKNELEALNWFRKATGMAEDELMLSSEVKALEAETEELRVALAVSEAEVAKLRESLTNSRRQMNNSQARLYSTRLELEEMRLRAAQAQTQGSQGADVAALNEKIRQKEAQLAANRDELMNLHTAFDRQQLEFSTQLNARESDQDSYQALLDLEREKISSLESQVKQLTSGLDLRKSELDNRNAQLAALRNQLEARAINDQTAADASIAELSAIISAQRVELEEKSQNIIELRDNLDKQQNYLASEQASFRERESQLRQSAKTSSAEQLAAMAQEANRIQGLQDQLSRLSSELDLKQTSLNQSNSRLATLNQQLDIANSDQARSEGSLAELSEIIDSQQADLEQKSLSFSYLEQELSNQKQQLSAERGAFEQQEQRLRKNVNLILAEQQSLQTRLEGTQSQLASYKQQLIESERRIQQQKTDIQHRQNEITGLQEVQQKRKSAQTMALEAQLGDYRIELVSTQGRNAALDAQINAMQIELERLRNQLSLVDISTAIAMRGTNPVPPRRLPRPDIPDVDFGNYYALIIGNNNYPQFANLETPVNDARAMAKLLEDKYRFKTQVLINADRYTILQTLNSFRERLTDEDNFLLYYAGHGALDEKNERGHWLPVDASPSSQANWISNVTITDYINTMTAKHIMVIADSCYSGTLTREVRLNLEGGKSEKMAIEFYKRLAKITSRTALTSGGTEPVMDGGGGDHSIFANSLLQSLEINNGIIEGPDLFFEVHQRVRSSGNNDISQVPTFDVIQNTGDLGAPFFFVPG